MLSSLGNPRQAAAQMLNFFLVLSTAFMVRFPACEISYALHPVPGHASKDFDTMLT